MDILSKSGIPATTETIEYLTKVPRARLSRMLYNRYVKKGLFSKRPKSFDEYKFKGHYVYSLTTKGKKIMNELIFLFSENKDLHKGKFDVDHSDIVLLPGLSDDLLSAISSNEYDEMGD